MPDQDLSDDCTAGPLTTLSTMTEGYSLLEQASDELLTIVEAVSVAKLGP